MQISSEPSRDSPSGAAPATRRAKFIVGAAVILVAVVGLVGWAMSRPGSTAFYVSVTELQAGGSSPSPQDYRVTGEVVPGTIARDGLETTFAITDGRSNVTVTTGEPLPDAFKERSEVVATGDFDGRRFSASQVLAKCPSKFKAKTTA